MTGNALDAVIEERVCETCGESVTYVPERERKSIAYPGWVHVTSGEAWAPGGGKTALDRHLASPRPRCPQCRSGAYVYTAEAWGDAWDCQDCKHHVYYSLGD